MIRRHLFLLIALPCLLVLSACVNLKPVPSETESYVLGPLEMSSSESIKPGVQPIYILRPQVPTFVDGSRLSYRYSSGELINMPGTRWAEPLAEGIARAMSLYLSGSGYELVEGYYPWPNTSSDAARLSLNFLRFGATDTGQVQVAVRWTLKMSDQTSKSGHYISRGLTWEVGQANTLVRAYNEALMALASDLKAQMQ